jgi:hypothetical protein
MTFKEWRRVRAGRRADRLALRAEHSSGYGWWEYRRHRSLSKRAIRARRRAEGRTGQNIEPDKAWAETFGSGGFFTKDPPPR